MQFTERTHRDGLKVNRFPAVQVLDTEMTPGFRWPGEEGCLRSHTGVIKLAKAMQWDSVCIFEDDAVPAVAYVDVLKQALSTLAQQPCWSLCYFFQTDDFKPRNPVQVGPGLIRVNGLLRTHAYAVHSGAYDVIINSASQHTISIDSLLCELLFKQLTTFSVKRDLFVQSDGFSDIRQAVRAGRYDLSDPSIA